MLLHGREDAQISLYTMVVVVTNIILNHIDQLFLGGKTLTVVAFSFQDTPESLHRPIVDAFGYTGHTLRHTGILQLLVERTVCVLIAPVAVKQGMCLRIRSDGLVQSLED